MAKIFISHSKHDHDVVDYLARVAAGTQVQLIFEELEGIIDGPATAERIRSNIEASNAVFVVVTPKLASLAHSRDWVAWETGVAAHRDVWVLERRADAGQVTIVTPALQHLVRFDPSDDWFPYFRSIIQPYDDSHVLPALALGGSIGHAFSKDGGAVIGAGLGLMIASVANPRPQGVPTCCVNCKSRYVTHLPVGETSFRCPVCNRIVTLQLAPPGPGLLAGIPAATFRST